MRRTIHLLSIGGIILTVVWACFDFGFSSVSGVIASLVAFLSSIEKSDVSHPIAPPPISFSDTAGRVLTEIDASDESDPKGVSIMMMGSALALYRPFIYNNHIHGSTSGNDYETDGVISAIDELVDSGFLIPHHVGGSLLQWRRTTKRRS